jgi:hypothetical protein
LSEKSQPADTDDKDIDAIYSSENKKSSNSDSKKDEVVSEVVSSVKVNQEDSESNEVSLAKKKSGSKSEKLD